MSYTYITNSVHYVSADTVEVALTGSVDLISCGTLTAKDNAAVDTVRGSEVSCIDFAQVSIYLGASAACTLYGSVSTFIGTGAYELYADYEMPGSIDTLIEYRAELNIFNMNIGRLEFWGSAILYAVNCSISWGFATGYGEAGLYATNCYIDTLKYIRIFNIIGTINTCIGWLWHCYSLVDAAFVGSDTVAVAGDATIGVNAYPSVVLGSTANALVLDKYNSETLMRARTGSIIFCKYWGYAKAGAAGWVQSAIPNYVLSPIFPIYPDAISVCTVCTLGSQSIDLASFTGFGQIQGPFQTVSGHYFADALTVNIGSGGHISSVFLYHVGGGQQVSLIDVDRVDAKYCSADIRGNISFADLRGCPNITGLTASTLWYDGTCSFSGGVCTFGSAGVRCSCSVYDSHSTFWPWRTREVVSAKTLVSASYVNIDTYADTCLCLSPSAVLTGFSGTCDCIGGVTRYFVDGVNVFHDSGFCMFISVPIVHGSGVENCGARCCGTVDGVHYANSCKLVTPINGGTYVACIITQIPEITQTLVYVTRTSSEYGTTRIGTYCEKIAPDPALFYYPGRGWVRTEWDAGWATEWASQSEQWIVDGLVISQRITTFKLIFPKFAAVWTDSEPGKSYSMGLIPSPEGLRHNVTSSFVYYSGYSTDFSRERRDGTWYTWETFTGSGYANTTAIAETVEPGNKYYWFQGCEMLRYDPQTSFYCALGISAAALPESITARIYSGFKNIDITGEKFANAAIFGYTVTALDHVSCGAIIALDTLTANEACGTYIYANTASILPVPGSTTISLGNRICADTLIINAPNCTVDLRGNSAHSLYITCKYLKNVSEVNPFIRNITAESWLLHSDAEENSANGISINGLVLNTRMCGHDVTIVDFCGYARGCTLGRGKGLQGGLWSGFTPSAINVKVKELSAPEKTISISGYYVSADTVNCATVIGSAVTVDMPVSMVFTGNTGLYHWSISVADVRGNMFISPNCSVATIKMGTSASVYVLSGARIDTVEYPAVGEFLYRSYDYTVTTLENGTPM